MAETIGRTAHLGLIQSNLTSLLSTTTNNLHQSLLHLRTRGLLVSVLDRGKSRLWLSHWKTRGDTLRELREERERGWEEWCSGQSARRRTKMEREHDRAPMRPYLAGEERSDGGLLMPELTWGVHPAPELKLTLSPVDQVYRVIAASGTMGATVTDLREALGGMGLKSFDKLLTAVGEMGVVSLTDRQGKSFTYRLLTGTNFDLVKAQGGVDAKAIKQERGQERKGEEEEEEAKQVDSSKVMGVDAAPPPAAPVPQQSSQPQSSPSLPESRVPTAESEESKSSQRSHPLLVYRRRQTTMRLLTEAPEQLLSVLSLHRSLTTLHPPAMTSTTLKAFISAMADEGSFIIHSFVFPSHSGRQTHTVKVLAAKRDGLTEEEAEVRRMRAYELAAVALTEGRLIGVASRVDRRGKEEREEKAAPSQEETAPPADGEEEKEEEASDDGSEAQAEATVKEKAMKGPNNTVLNVNKSLTGFVRPLGARAHLLHRLLWTTYRGADNPVVSSTSPSSPLSFRYTQLIHCLTLRDLLLLNGLGVKDIDEVPFVLDRSLYGLRLDQLPADVQRLIDIKQPKSWPRLKHLYRTLDLLRQLHLIEPLLDGKAAATPQSVLTAPVHFEYSLTPSLRVASTTFDFSSPDGLSQYWAYVRRSCIQPKGSLDIPALSREWRIPASLLTQLQHAKRWRYRVTLSNGERQALRHFDDAAGASDSSSMLHIEQIRRAARVTNTSATAVATFYSRIHFPQLAAVHDELSAYEDATRNNREEQGEGNEGEDEAKGRKRRRGKKEMAELRAKEREEQEARARADFARALLPLTADTAVLPPLSPLRHRRKRRTAAPANEQPPPSPEAKPPSPPSKPSTRPGRGRGKRINSTWAPGEDEELISLYNEWLDDQLRAGALPFSFSPPPHVDLAADDKFPFAWTVSNTSSLSPFAASLHSLLPLMWLDHAQSPPSPLPLRKLREAQETQTGTVTRGGLSEALLQARRDFVLHETPLPAKAISTESSPSTAAQPALPVESAPDAAAAAQSEADAINEEQRKEETKEQKEGEPSKEGKVQRGTGHNRKVQLAASSTLLKPFYAKAASHLQRRSVEIVQHRMDTFRSRLSLPVGLSSATRKRPILSTPYTVAHLASKPELMALTTLIKAIILQPSTSYQYHLAHQATRHYTDEQVQLVLAVLRSDRWIAPRKLTERGSERAWLLTNATQDLLFGKDRENRPTIDEWRKQWRDAPFGRIVELHAPLEKRQAEALIDDLAPMELQVLRPDVGQAVEEVKARDDQQMTEEATDEVKEEAAKGKAATDEQVEEGGGVASERKQQEDSKQKSDPVDRAAVKAAIVDLSGPSISLLSTRWLLAPDPNLPLSHLHSLPLSSAPPPAVEADVEEGVDVEEDDEEQSAAMEDENEVDEVADDSLLVQLLPEREGAHSNAENEAIFDDANEESVQLSQEVVHTLMDAGGAGLSMAELAAQLKMEDAERLDAAVQRALRHLLAVRVFSFDHHRFVAEPFASRWSFPEQRGEDAKARDEAWRAVCLAGAKRLERGAAASGGAEVEERRAEMVSAVVAHPWRLMGGEVHEELWTSVYHAVLGSVSEWPGLKEDRLLAMFPVLTPMEMRHIIDTLLLDDAIVRRRWKQNKRRGEETEALEDGGGAAQLEEVTCYFPCTQAVL